MGASISAERARRQATTAIKASEATLTPSRNAPAKRERRRRAELDRAETDLRATFSEFTDPRRAIARFADYNVHPVAGAAGILNEFLVFILRQRLGRFLRQHRQPVEEAFGEPVGDVDVPTLDIAVVSQTIDKREGGRAHHGSRRGRT